MAKIFSPIIIAFMLALLPSLYGNTSYALTDDQSSSPVDQKIIKKFIPDKKCNKCHADEDEKVWEMDDGREKHIFVDPNKFQDSVHNEQKCVGCHNKIVLKKGEHEEDLPVSVSCVQCHEKLWKEEKGSSDPKHKRLKVVMENIDSYMHSVHARPNNADQSKTNATCHDCHDAHNVGTIGSEAKAENRLNNPETCGKCHEKEKEAYLGSVHGKEVVDKKNTDAAVCSDCHTTHNIESPDADPVKLAITKNCGSCHETAFKTYMSSYHGQVNRLGYTNTAKCFDCHGSHDLQKVDDPTSKVHLDNRLETCQTCHEGAPEGFLDFHAHANPDDFDRYPWIWLTAKFMNLLILGVFAFFWTHVILWLFREFRDRQQGKGFIAPVQSADEQVYFRRFSFIWRIVHLLFAVSTMTLVLTGSTLLFSHTAWAAFVMKMLGGPEVEAIVHRTAAVTWLSVFIIHLLVAIFNIIRTRKKFSWLGPTSMIPNMQDLRDVGAMFRWFFGRGSRPDFDRWSYWQKFDYWAPFWGAGVIGISGLLLFSPTITAQIMPGFVFNIAMIVHAEEALLATVFLFSVHFFNVHFRPDKFPMSTTIFTGTVPLEEYKHEHKMEYERLKDSGELEKYLVRRPSKVVATGSKYLSAILIFCGLGLLALVFIGYFTLL